MIYWYTVYHILSRHSKTGEYDWTFPRLIICSNSMHSKQKLLRYGMDQRLIEQFYGSYEEYAGMNRSQWKEIVRKGSFTLVLKFVNQILTFMRNLQSCIDIRWPAFLRNFKFKETEANFAKDDMQSWDLGDLFQRTRASYYLIQCRINGADCKPFWNLTRTITGVCLRYPIFIWCKACIISY